MPSGKKKKNSEVPAATTLDTGDEAPDVYNAKPALMMNPANKKEADDAETVAIEADPAAADAAFKEATAAAKAVAEAEAARAKVQAAAEAEAEAKAEAKAAADAAKVALAQAEVEVAAADKLASEEAQAKTKKAASTENIQAQAGVDAEASAGSDGEKFVRVVSECGQEVVGKLSGLGVNDVRSGMLMLSHRYIERSKTRMVAFKSHALDLMETACAPAPQGGSVLSSLRKEVPCSADFAPPPSHTPPPLAGAMGPNGAPAGGRDVRLPRAPLHHDVRSGSLPV
jgi:hypothetical protein